jgi:bacillithiol system protein YtxJ
VIKDLENYLDYENMLELSKSKPVFLYKHSTTCPISAGVWMDVRKFSEQNDAAVFYRVLVRENRELSLEIAEKSGVKHESPQMILFKDGKPVWNSSHYDITVAAMTEVLSQ